MVVEVIRYEVASARSEDFAEAYARAARVLDADEHCLAYDVSQGVEEPANWVVRIEWNSIEGHEQGFRGRRRTSASSSPQSARSSTTSAR